MVFLESWLGLASVAGVSVRVMARRDRSKRLSSSVVADEFASLVTLRTMFVLGTRLDITVCGP